MRTNIPLLEITRGCHISASLSMMRIPQPVDQYAAFIKASADVVVDKALNYVFAKDRDFQDSLKTPETRPICTTLCVGKPRVPKWSNNPRRRSQRDSFRGTRYRR